MANHPSSLQGKNEIKLASLSVFSQEKKLPFIVGFLNFSMVLKHMLKVAAFKAQAKFSKLLRLLNYGHYFLYCSFYL